MQHLELSVAWGWAALGRTSTVSFHHRITYDPPSYPAFLGNMPKTDALPIDIFVNLTTKVMVYFPAERTEPCPPLSPLYLSVSLVQTAAGGNGGGVTAWQEAKTGKAVEGHEGSQWTSRTLPDSRSVLRQLLCFNNNALMKWSVQYASTVKEKHHEKVP